MIKMIKNNLIFDYFFLTFGSALMALGIGVFLVDAMVVPGGVSGIALSIYYMTNKFIPVGLTVWILNIPLFAWGYKELGKKFSIRTFFGLTSNAFFIDLFRGDIPGLRSISLNDSPTILDLQQKDFLFLILIGAVLIGIGLGIMFKFNGTTGGTAIIAAILQKHYSFKPGQIFLVLDSLVILLAGFIIEYKGIAQERPAFSLTLFAFFLLIVSSKMLDAVIDGFDYARQVLIFSDKKTEIADAIMLNLNRGCTAFKTRSLYKNIDREAIMTIIKIRDLSKLEEIIHSIDDDAFVIINTVHEIQGKGFRRRI